MTKKLFWSDPYLCTCDTIVLAVFAETVSLRETVFFAYSGGQESDSGTIGGYAVIEARNSGYEILYTLSPNHRLQPDNSARVEINWDRRYRIMRLHFAAELILELAFQKFAGLEKIGAHIAAEKARIDFAWPESIFPHLTSLAAEAQEIIDRDCEIISAFSDKRTQRRYWEVPGFARVPCGGTHLHRTGEVGKLTLKRKNIGKGKEHIEIYLAPEETHA
jgi:Ser-tRNA(Ala) deacylase AlaX